MSLPLAYYLTWSTYGTRLHGDERGTVDLKHNIPNTPRLAPSAARKAYREGTLRHAPVVLTDEARAVVERAVAAHADLRRWRILAINIRTNHAHVVADCTPAVAAGGDMPTPERVLSEFKSWGTRWLRREGLIARDTRVWTDHGSTRWINHPNGLAGAIDYVLTQQ